MYDTPPMSLTTMYDSIHTDSQLEISHEVGEMRFSPIVHFIQPIHYFVFLFFHSVSELFITRKWEEKKRFTKHCLKLLLCFNDS